MDRADHQRSRAGPDEAVGAHMAEDRSVLAIFVDVRGFTRWSETNEVFINLDQFIAGFFTILRRRFPETYSLKPLGDGALLICEIPERNSPRELAAMLSRVLTIVNRVDADFARHCAEFANRVGHRTDLRLGWGVVRKVIRTGDDWAGHNLNKCSRLCAEARPFGIVIDRDDFPELPRDVRGMTSQIRRLRGIGEVPVWVSHEIASQFVPRERLRETPEVHVAGICFTEDHSGGIRLLLARRSAERALFPGLLEGCGGQLRYSETFTDGVRRHFQQEMGLDVEVREDLHCFYTIREADVPVIPGIRFLCRRVGRGEPSSGNHSELRWMSEEEFAAIPATEFVGGLKAEVLELLARYRQTRQR
ncbi:NUDIX domain-containing protein [Solwaraspora sp. WMMA2056]|uniref:NUDIX domain-containing protein n=1 Tax=Solwaraspora sp. WMMA2056 TaxID=3015161 RepID=UPI00259BDB8C|nr:NUDIX domain-containing protein [Solwaraspora sp. WMMA2056]WJK39204.1 NUDIX domain-containing protein [Solwaraspora sp. WMMA2056]